MRTSIKTLASLVLLFFLVVSAFGGAMFFSANLSGTPVTLYYGYGCNGTTTNTCTVGGVTTNNAGFAYGFPITTGSDTNGYNVLACGLNFPGTPAVNMQCAVYASGVTTSPVTNCVATAAVSAAAGGWVEDTNFTSCTLAANTQYYIIFQQSASANINQDATGSTQLFNGPGVTFGTFSNNVTWSSNASGDSVYIRVQQK